VHGELSYSLALQAVQFVQTRSWLPSGPHASGEKLTPGTQLVHFLQTVSWPDPHSLATYSSSPHSVQFVQTKSSGASGRQVPETYWVSASHVRQGRQTALWWMLHGCSIRWPSGQSHLIWHTVSCVRVHAVIWTWSLPHTVQGRH